MAVLCEAISVVLRADRLITAFGSFDLFKEEVPNRTLAADGELVRIGFMSPDDVRSFVGYMERKGLVYQQQGQARDMVVVDQLTGPLAPCDWIEFGQVKMNGHEVSAARLSGSSLESLVTPDGWEFSKSLSQAHGFVPAGQVAKSLRFLRSQDGLDVYLNALTGKEVFIGRTDKT
jgi:hypothetical protein